MCTTLLVIGRILSKKNVTIHNYYICKKQNCHDINTSDKLTMTKDKKFKHKWLFDSSLSQCQETGIWSLCYVDGIGMFCSVCQMHDSGHQQTNVKVWNASPNVRYRTETIRQHFIKSKEVKATMHSLAADKEKQKSKSYFVKEDQRKEKVMNPVYHKVFASLYWLCKEEIAVSKAVSY